AVLEAVRDRLDDAFQHARRQQHLAVDRAHRARDFADFDVHAGAPSSENASDRADHRVRDAKSADLVDALVADVDRLDRDLVLPGVEARAAVLDRQAAAEVPDDRGTALGVEQRDRAVATRAFAGNETVVPVPQLGVEADATLERDVRPGYAAGEFQRRAVV